MLRSPFVVVSGHCPFYSTNVNHYLEWQTVDMKASLEPLFQRYGVDLVLSGHVHAYQRTLPVFNDTIAPYGIYYPPTTNDDDDSSSKEKTTTPMTSLRSSSQKQKQKQKQKRRWFGRQEEAQQQPSPQELQPSPQEHRSEAAARARAAAKAKTDAAATAAATAGRSMGPVMAENGAAEAAANSWKVRELSSSNACDPMYKDADPFGLLNDDVSTGAVQTGHDVGVYIVENASAPVYIVTGNGGVSSISLRD
jgi:hypothetical protein